MASSTRRSTRSRRSSRRKRSGLDTTSCDGEHRRGRGLRRRSRTGAHVHLCRARGPRARAGLPTARGDRREPVFALTPAGRDALSGSARLGARQLVTLRALEAGAVSSADLADAGGSAVAARALAKRGLVLEGARSVRRIPREFALGEDDAVRDATATAGQADALGTIVD